MRKLVLLMVSLFVIGYFLGQFGMRTEAVVDARYKYTAIKIEVDETLQDIVKKYNKSSLSDREYAKKLMEINDMEDEEIISGRYITIFYQ